MTCLCSSRWLLQLFLSWVPSYSWHKLAYLALLRVQSLLKSLKRSDHTKTFHQGPLIEFAVKSQQGEFFIRKVGAASRMYRSCHTCAHHPIPMKMAIYRAFQVALQLKGELYIHQGELSTQMNRSTKKMK